MPDTHIGLAPRASFEATALLARSRRRQRTFGFTLRNWLGIGCTIWLAVSNDARPAEPLHAQVDQLLDAAHPEGQTPLASDADFLRRAYLALTG
ncbi:MAG: hypothetical protein M3463_23365, partial [Verrucomicrobiota bacterium]|nr:hypothetical protein [Verrucomicrobiota bacterium]